MANTRSMTRKLNYDGSGSWSNFDHELLFLIMLQLGFFDFIAFSSVCKSWRSFAISNWNRFMVSKQPVYLSISSCLNEKECYLEDYKRRKFRTTFTHSNGRVCVGITCGYFIFFERKTGDFWLVNPFTGKKLHFLGFPYFLTDIPKDTRGILVFSPAMSSWVFVVITHEFPNSVAFSLPNERGVWYHVVSPFTLHDIHFFKGKIYALDRGNNLCELRLYPKPTLTILKMKNFPWSRSHFRKLEFVSSSENLYVVDASGDVFEAFEVDFGKMEWVNSKMTIGEYAVFLSEFKCGAAVKLDAWVQPQTHYEKLNYSDRYDQSKEVRNCLTANMWYFPQHCLINNKSGKKDCVLLNIVEDQRNKVGESSCAGSSKHMVRT